MQRSAVAGLQLFDCLAIFILLRGTEERIVTDIAFSPVVTARFQHTRGRALNLRYSEYDFFPEPWCHGRERDLQLQRGFARGDAPLDTASDAFTNEDLHRQLSLLVFIKQRLRPDSIGGRLVRTIERIVSRVR